MSVEKGRGDLYGHNNHCSCASRDQRSHQISSCRDLNPITCRGQGKEFFFPEELQDWLNSPQGGLARPGRITLLATAQEQGDAPRVDGPGGAIPLFLGGVTAQQQGETQSQPGT